MSVTVPTVDRGFRFAACRPTLIAGESPRMASTFGLLMDSAVIIPRDSRYNRWHSLRSVSMTRVDFPEPEGPVTTTN